ncbi:MAG TPA: T9SS type A sorting domain-containing protein [Edaphocola sp.]|nr:T9SS type A sorting domain-containing protein [Edaphocola sp.]
MNHFKKLGIIVGIIAGQSTYAATNINSSEVNGTWTLANSPYYIYNDITVPLNQNLTIQPGVEVIFMDNYKFDVYGTISAIGTPEQKIVFKANNPSQWSNFSIPDGGWGGLYAYVSHFATNVPLPLFEYCVFRDVKKIQGGVVLGANYLNVEINHCEFFNNYSSGIIITSYFGYNSISKIKFTNNVIYNNYADKIMHCLFTDSSIITNNSFYSNTSKYDVFANLSYDTTTNNILIFESNEMYDNHVSDNAAIFRTESQGQDFIRNNKFHHNTTTLKGAVSIQSTKALIENNLISNNSRVQKEGFYCGINDGGAGLHLLGKTVLFDEANMNIFTVRNNIISNNYSDMDGAGIWANHCKATIINNTIINNSSEDPGAAIHGWGTHCKVDVQNNIIHGNEIKTPGGFYDTGYYNFNFSPTMLYVNISNNLIDYQYANAPSNINGLSINSYDHNIELANPTNGIDLSFDATVADFSPTSLSINIIDKGNNNAPQIGNTDYLGNTRIINGLIDYGAIEYIKAIGTGLNSKGLTNKFNLFPIPTIDWLNVESRSGDLIKSIHVLNLTGSLHSIINNPIINNGIVKIDLSHLEAGIYYLQIESYDSQIAFQKIIKK